MALYLKPNFVDTSQHRKDSIYQKPAIRGSCLMEAIQVINTAIIKNKEKRIDKSYEKRLNDIFQGPVVNALNKAIISLSESEKISRDQAAMMIFETTRELDNIWNDFVMMEGIGKLKEMLRQQPQ